MQYLLQPSICLLFSMKKVAILGSTGSIGTQTLQVISEHKDTFVVWSLVAYSNKDLLDKQTYEYAPQYSALISRDGVECLVDAVKGADVAVIATRGIVALDAVLYCINNNIDVALANKEVLVTAGKLVVEALKSSKAKLLPVDSEHSAIWQCLQNTSNKPAKLLLTASGGAFLGKTTEQLSNVTASDALKHPNWNMGAKITIDSATMMNKAFEVVEACYLFGVDAKDVQIVVHPQSIVHSLVQFADNSVIAQMSLPSMKLPIQYALTYPNRVNCNVNTLDLASVSPLTFAPVDDVAFPCAKLGHEVFSKHPLVATVLNAANDVAVDYFLQGKIAFLSIYSTVRYIIDFYEEEVQAMDYSLESIKNLDAVVRKYTKSYLENLIV